MKSNDDKVMIMMEIESNDNETLPGNDDKISNDPNHVHIKGYSIQRFKSFKSWLFTNVCNSMHYSF